MSDPNPKTASGELTMIYMNGSIVPLTGHELVAALRNRYAVVMLLATVILLSIPSGGGLLGDGDLWLRIIVNAAAVCAFIALFPALLFDAQHRARRQGRTRLALITISVPAAILSTLSAQAFGVILADSTISRWGMAAKLGLGILFWEVVAFLGIWFYGPVLLTQSARTSTETTDDTLLTLGPLRINPQNLTRIETDGRYLHLHLDGTVQTISARLKDVDIRLDRHGLLVHRCHWVAFDQLGPVVVKGRSYEMTTRDGGKVPVARDRRDAVRAALAKVTRP